MPKTILLCTSLTLACLGMVTGSEARALSIDLVQVGGTYDGVYAHPGDTLVLEIVVSLDAGDSIGSVDPAISFDPDAMMRDWGNALEIGGLTCCTSLLDPSFEALFVQIDFGDIDEVIPGQLRGWGMESTLGAMGPGSFSPGRAAFVLMGFEGIVSTADTVGNPFGTIILDEKGIDITLDPSIHLGTFQVLGAPIPEPSSAILLASGLVGLAAARELSARLRLAAR